MAARALTLPSFAALKPEELPKQLERLVEELRAELASIRALPRGAWAVAPTVLVPVSGVTHDLAFGTGSLCDTTGGIVSVRFPYATRANVGQFVAIIQTSTTNNVVAYPAGGQFVQGSSNQTLTTERVREFMWTGDGAARGWRLVG